MNNIHKVETIAAVINIDDILKRNNTKIAVDRGTVNTAFKTSPI